MTESPKRPRVFVSYSWTSPEQMARVIEWCERLVRDGVDVVFDRWELSEGHDKYAFMERMVLDDSVTHVLIFSDSKYQEKANSRDGGVGVESQIISTKIYNEVRQDKFIPIVCQFDGDKACVPVFLEGRIFIDFSNPEKVNKEWEKLIRKLFNKPLLKKPDLGPPPSYILEDGKPANLTRAKYETVRDAILRSKGHANLAVADYQEAFFRNMESFRVHRTEGAVLDDLIVGSIDNLLPYRDELLGFAELLVANSDKEDNREALFDLYERLLYYKFHPDGMDSWNPAQFDNYGFFLYESFLYLVADLTRLRLFDVLKDLFERVFILPENGRQGDEAYSGFVIFWHESESLKVRRQRLNLQILDMDADLINKRTTIRTFPMKRIIEAEFITFLRSVIHSQVFWFPRTLRYAGYSRTLEWFLRGTEKKHFKNICSVLGVTSKDDLTQRIKAKFEENRFLGQWFSAFGFRGISLEGLMNLSKLDTV